MEALLNKSDGFTPDTTGLITGWEQVDELTWRFTIREGVSFHNGEPFDGAAAAFSVLNNRDNGILTFYFEPITDARAIDATTIEVITAFPTGEGLVPALMTEIVAYPPQYYAEVGTDQFGLAPVGTGPVVFEEWRPGESIRGSAFADYWQGAPLIDEFVFTFAPDGESRVNFLLTGEADLTVSLPPQSVSTVDASNAASIVTLPGSFKFFMNLNVTGPPDGEGDPTLRDIRVRQAIQYAIDSQLLVDTILGGVGGEVNANLMHSVFDSAGANADVIRTYDLDAAKALVEEVRAEGGLLPIELNSTVGRYLLDAQVAEALAGMLEVAGFEVVRNAREPGDFSAALFGNTMAGIGVLGFDPRYPHEDVFMQTTFTSDGLVRFCASDELDRLAAEGLRAATRAERNQIYQEMERVVMVDMACWVSLYDITDIYGVSTNLGGFEPRFDLMINYEDLFFLG